MGPNFKVVILIEPLFRVPGRITIYAPVIYTRPGIMFWRRGYTLRGEVGGGWALEFPSFLGPVKWHPADRRVPFGALQLGGGKAKRGWFSYLIAHVVD
jgi:hypothetical protein